MQKVPQKKYHGTIFFLYFFLTWYYRVFGHVPRYYLIPSLTVLFVGAPNIMVLLTIFMYHGIIAYATPLRPKQE